MKSKDWTKKSQKVLLQAIKRIKLLLLENNRSKKVIYKDYQPRSIYRDVGICQDLDPKTSALGNLCDAFDLSEFECKTLLLVAGTELLPGFRSLIGEAMDLSTSSYPTLDLACELFDSDESFEYYSLLDYAPLRDWELIRFKQSGDSWQFRGLEMDEKILAYLLGYSCLDKRLKNYVFPQSSSGQKHRYRS